LEENEFSTACTTPSSKVLRFITSKSRINKEMLLFFLDKNCDQACEESADPSPGRYVSAPKNWRPGLPVAIATHIQTKQHDRPTLFLSFFRIGIIPQLRIRPRKTLPSWRPTAASGDPRILGLCSGVCMQSIPFAGGCRGGVWQLSRTCHWRL